MTLDSYLCQKHQVFRSIVEIDFLKFKLEPQATYLML